ncbi:MAG TPA: methylenetetrahydrofolate reductase [NAD(P)H] [Bacteroidales bacterium]|jgi:methylenetetrahydrofolate reductase (NADPH)|nr:methylenetetrahydrofolate reductase [NAD(P)H] [Bacteroidales bacterium]
MKITDLFKNKERTFSFEFFPPKDEISAVDFGINVGQLLMLNPSFVSVTYGAGGSTQERTFALVNYLQNKIGLNTMAHYTCVGSSREKVAHDMEYLKSIGIENVMLLRGDPPKGMTNFVPEKDGFNFANELIEFVTAMNYGFSVGAAANPEKHPESSTMDTYINNLKLKCKAGANFLVTQLFFDNDAYFNFVRRIREEDIACRIIPGIIPITSYKQIKRFVDMASTTFPRDLLEKMEVYKDNDEKAYQVGVEHAIKQCLDLLIKGAPGIHFYTLNKSRAAVEVFESLPSSLR